MSGRIVRRLLAAALVLAAVGFSPAAARDG
jgi:hypothetical protein